MRLSAPALALLLCAGAVAPAAAQTGPWDISVGAGTDNRARDTSRSNGDPYAWGRAIWNTDDRAAYAGAAAETLDMGGAKWGTGVMAGVRPQWAGFDFDLNAAYKLVVDADNGFDDDTWEFSADMKRGFGQASTRLRFQYSPDGLGGTEAWTWVSAQAGWAFNDKLRASAEIGYRDQEKSVNYTGWNIGATYSLTPKIDLDLRYHDTDADIPGEQYSDALVAGVALKF